MRHLGLEVNTTKEPINMTFVQESGMTTQVITSLNFEVSDTKFIENFTVLT